MFIPLLIVTLLTAVATSVIVILLFRKATLKIFMRIIGEEIAAAWNKFILFALFVVGVSSGIQLWKLERYLPGEGPDPAQTLVLNGERWVFEVFRTIISTLGGLAWALLVFFIIALVAFALVRLAEIFRKSKEEKGAG